MVAPPSKAPELRLNAKYNCGLSDDKLIIEMKKYGDVLTVKPSNSNIHNGNQAKLARLYISQYFLDDICTLVDIDYYLFDYGIKWLRSKIDNNLDKFIFHPGIKFVIDF